MYRFGVGKAFERGCDRRPTTGSVLRAALAVCKKSEIEIHLFITHASVNFKLASNLKRVMPKVFTLAGKREISYLQLRVGLSVQSLDWIANAKKQDKL